MLSKVFNNVAPKRLAQRHRTISQLRRLLELETRVYLRDLDSTMLAHQLTLVDRELFLRIPGQELHTIAYRRTSRDAPNFGAWVAFAHRISCLMASEILAEKKVNRRAMLVAKLLNVVRKCFEIGNFHSARSVLAGLQSPGIYRSVLVVYRHFLNKFLTSNVICSGKRDLILTK